MIVDYIKNIDFYKEFDKLYQKLKIIEDIKDKKLVFDGNKIDINENDTYFIIFGIFLYTKFNYF
jgi:hypothetical protein